MPESKRTACAGKPVGGGVNCMTFHPSSTLPSILATSRLPGIKCHHRLTPYSAPQRICLLLASVYSDTGPNQPFDTPPAAADGKLPHSLWLDTGGCINTWVGAIDAADC